MSFSGFDEPAWGISQEPPEADIVTEALKKEQVIKEIITAQEGLRALLTRISSVQSDVDKLASGNAMLQMYIDNLTMQLAKRRG